MTDGATPGVLYRIPLMAQDEFAERTAADVTVVYQHLHGLHVGELSVKAAAGTSTIWGWSSDGGLMLRVRVDDGKVWGAALGVDQRRPVGVPVDDSSAKSVNVLATNGVLLAGSEKNAPNLKTSLAKLQALGGLQWFETVELSPVMFVRVHQ